MLDTLHNAMNAYAKKQKHRSVPRVIPFLLLLLKVMALDSGLWVTQLYKLMGSLRCVELIFLCILSSAFERWQFVFSVILEQAAEVGRRQLRNKEIGGNADNTLKLQVAEQKMGELASAMAVLGKEAAAAMTAVEAQQQRLTLQRLIAMVKTLGQYEQDLTLCFVHWTVTHQFMHIVALFNDVHVKVQLKILLKDPPWDFSQVEAERSYHQRVAEILDQLHAQVFVSLGRQELWLIARFSSFGKLIFVDKWVSCFNSWCCGAHCGENCI